MIALLSGLAPLRLANFARLELGRDLVDYGGGDWWLEIRARTKTDTAIELPFPAELVPAARPAGYLAGNPALWPTQRGTTECYDNLARAA